MYEGTFYCILYRTHCIVLIRPRKLALHTRKVFSKPSKAMVFPSFPILFPPPTLLSQPSPLTLTLTLTHTLTQASVCTNSTNLINYLAPISKFSSYKHLAHVTQISCNKEINTWNCRLQHYSNSVNDIWIETFIQ